VFASYIYNGLSSVFHIGRSREGPTLKSYTRNHPSAAANAQIVREYICGELEAGRLVGPLDDAILSLVQISPIGLVPKAHQSNKWRTIVDLSSPHNHSVNDGIPQDLSSISYVRVDDAVEHILLLGREGGELVKVSIVSFQSTLMTIIFLEYYGKVRPTLIGPCHLAEVCSKDFIGSERHASLGIQHQSESETTTWIISFSSEHLTQIEGPEPCQQPL